MTRSINSPVAITSMTVSEIKRNANKTLPRPRLPELQMFEETRANSQRSSLF